MHKVFGGRSYKNRVQIRMGENGTGKGCGDYQGAEHDRCSVTEAVRSSAIIVTAALDLRQDPRRSGGD